MKRRLGVNIDHVATLREARKVCYPDPFETLPILKKCHVDQVTLHLREDRRHIQDHDLVRFIAEKDLPVNLEMAVTDAMLKIALKFYPATCTFVPEKRQEVTTEGGLDTVKKARAVGRAIERLQAKGVHVSLFIDPDPRQILMANRLGADAVELHTGAYCSHLENYHARHGSYRIKAGSTAAKPVEIAYQALVNTAHLADDLHLGVYAGHGLHIHNLAPIVKIPQIEEYNIGHAIVARAVFVGLAAAIGEIQKILNGH